MFRKLDRKLVEEYIQYRMTGISNKTICDILGISLNTFNSWVEEGGRLGKRRRQSSF